MSENCCLLKVIEDVKNGVPCLYYEDHYQYNVNILDIAVIDDYYYIMLSNNQIIISPRDKTFIVADRDAARNFIKNVIATRDNIKNDKESSSEVINTESENAKIVKNIGLK